MPTSSAATSANSTTYQDATGENPNAPDVTTITVSNDDARLVTFRVNVPNRPTLTGDMLVFIAVDIDKNGTTGDPDFGGSEYVIQIFRGEVGLFRWDGTNFTRSAGDPPATTLAFSWSGGATIRLNAAELGTTTSFEFQVLVVSGIVTDSAGNSDFTNAQFDSAPNTGEYAYDVRVATQPPTGRVRITSLSISPRKPVAGQSFEVSVRVARVGSPGRWEGIVYCSTLPGVQTRWFGSVSPGRAACRWDIPGRATGKRVRGFIQVSEPGGPRVTRRFNLPVVSPQVVLVIPRNAVTTVPARPQAGRQFHYALNVNVRRGSGAPTPIRRGRVRCTGSIDGQALRVIGNRIREGDGDALCSWEIPPRTSGRLLIGQVVVTAEGKTLRHSFRLRVA